MDDDRHDHGFHYAPGLCQLGSWAYALKKYR